MLLSSIIPLEQNWFTQITLRAVKWSPSFSEGFWGASEVNTPNFTQTGVSEALISSDSNSELVMNKKNSKIVKKKKFPLGFQKLWKSNIQWK